MNSSALGFDWSGTFASLTILVVILVLSAVITNWFARTMYKRCAACGALNAKRRERCRICENPFE